MCVFIYIYRAPALQPSTVTAPSAARPSPDTAVVRYRSIYLIYRCVCVHICVFIYIYRVNPCACVRLYLPRSGAAA